MITKTMMDGWPDAMQQVGRYISNENEDGLIGKMNDKNEKMMKMLILK